MKQALHLIFLILPGITAFGCSTTTIHATLPPPPTAVAPDRSGDLTRQAQPSKTPDEESFFEALSEPPKRKPEPKKSVASGRDIDPSAVAEMEVQPEQNCTCPLPERMKPTARPDRYQADRKPSPPESDFSAPEPTVASVSVPANAPVDRKQQDEGSFEQVGTASWYGRDFDGKKTASGEIYDSRALTAAHRSIPLGSVILVKNIENGKEVIVTVNDRGPYVSGRVLDVSEYASEVLGYKEQGLTTVGIRVLRKGDKKELNKGVTASYYRPAGQSVAGDGKLPLYLRKAKFTEDAADVVPFGNQRSYSVQVGVFGDLNNAVGMKSLLASYGQKVTIYKRQNQYLVSVGSFSSRYEAERLKDELVSDGYRGFILEPGSGQY